MKVKHVYLFSSYNVHGVSTRYRGTYVLKELREQYGISSNFVYPGYRIREVLYFIITFFAVALFRKRNSLVIYQKIHSRGIYASLLKLLLRISPENTIYDTDDADYIRFWEGNILHFMEHCSLCTVGSQALANYALKKSNNVQLIGSAVIDHDERKQNRNKILHIGWIGDYGTNNGTIAPYSHKVSLTKLVFPMLKDIAFPIKLTLLGIKDPDDKSEIIEYFRHCPNISLCIPENIDWLDETGIYRSIKEFDVGISPMVDHAFNEAKSAFKAKQYMSCGVPVLASPVGENCNVIRDGFNGYICSTAEEYQDRIIEFNQMSSERYSVFQESALQDAPKYRIDQFCKKLVGLTSRPAGAPAL